MLGLVSLLLFVFESSGIGLLDETNQKYLETVHLALFIVAVVYVGMCAAVK